MAKPNISPETLLAQSMHYIAPESGAIVPPIQPSTTFARDAEYNPIGDYLYSRYDFPGLSHAEEMIAALERGQDSLLFSSGLAAVAAIMETVPSGGHIVIPRVMYFGAQAWIKRQAEKRSMALSVIDQTSQIDIANSLTKNGADLLWIETPANPTWDVVDIGATAALAREAGAKLIVDGTAAPPCTTQALALGADIVLHSATKYLNGHSDLTAGVLTTNALDHQWEEIGLVRRYSGAVLGAFETWLLVRGMRTLYVRFRQCSKTAMRFATHFEGHPKISQVIYPGLSSHPGHEIAKCQMQDGFGGMLSVLVDGDFERARKIAGATRVLVPATSLGGVESLIEHRKSVEGPESPVPNNLLRLSIGLEHIDDLVKDFDQALHVN